MGGGRIMTWYLIVIIVIYFGFNLFAAIWLSRASRGATTYILNIWGFAVVFLFGGLVGVITLMGNGIKGIIRCLKRSER